MGKLLCEKKPYGTFGVEMRAYGQKLVKFCKHTDASKLVVEITTAIVYCIDCQCAAVPAVCSLQVMLTQAVQSDDQN